MGYPDELTIEVTENDIEDGARRTCDRCPIALAAQRKRQNATDWFRVGSREISVYNDKFTCCIRTRYAIPSEAQAFIRDFDQHRDIKPFTFTALRVS